MRCWWTHNWEYRGDFHIPWRSIRRCRRCGIVQAQVTGFLWGTRWFVMDDQMCWEIGVPLDA